MESELNHNMNNVDNHEKKSYNQETLSKNRLDKNGSMLPSIKINRNLPRSQSSLYLYEQIIKSDPNNNKKNNSKLISRNESSKNLNQDFQASYKIDTELLEENKKYILTPNKLRTGSTVLLPSLKIKNENLVEYNFTDPLSKETMKNGKMNKCSKFLSHQDKGRTKKFNTEIKINLAKEDYEKYKLAVEDRQYQRFIINDYSSILTRKIQTLESILKNGIVVN